MVVGLALMPFVVQVPVTGTILGPLIAGAGMDWIGISVLTVICTLLFAIYLPITLVGWFRSLPQRCSS